MINHRIYAFICDNRNLHLFFAVENSASCYILDIVEKQHSQKKLASISLVLRLLVYVFRALFSTHVTSENVQNYGHMHLIQCNGL